MTGGGGKRRRLRLAPCQVLAAARSCEHGPVLKCVVSAVSVVQPLHAHLLFPHVCGPSAPSLHRSLSPPLARPLIPFLRLCTSLK